MLQTYHKEMEMNQINIEIDNFKKTKKISLDLAYLIGQKINDIKYSDDELKLMYRITAICLSYFEGRGSYFGLVISKLRQDRENFESYLIARGIKYE